MRAVLHAFTLVMRTRLIPAFVVLKPTVATPLAFVFAASDTPTPVNRTFTPFTGFRDRVTLASSACRAPFAFTSLVWMVRTRHRFAAGVAVGFGVGFGLTGGVTAGVKGATGGVVTTVSAQSLLFAGFVSPPSPATVAQLSYVPPWVTRAETPIVRMTPGPSVPRLQLSSAGVTVQVPSTGCVVTARNVTPP